MLMLADAGMGDWSQLLDAGDPADPSGALPTEVFVRYTPEDASEVVLVWGVDGWGPLPPAELPAGTEIVDGLMNTTMTESGGVFGATVVARPGSTIDYGFLMDQWDTYFPTKPKFELCAYYDCSVCPNIEHGMHQGKEKFTSANQMNQEQADHLLKAVKAQASTELGSIQQHRLTLARAEHEQDQVWILRMMAEELRHGYQMFSIMLEDDWTSVTDMSGEEMFEDVLSMRTGSHVLGAFNIDFDSFLDNSTFCAVIDRVGKYQLA